MFLPIRNARKRERDGGEWMVLHPSNDAILAYCKTEIEADWVIAALNALNDNPTEPTFEQVRAFFQSWGMYPHNEDCNDSESDDEFLNPEVIEQGINRKCFEKLVGEAERMHGFSFRQFCSRMIDATDDSFYLRVGTWAELESAWKKV